MAFVNEKPKGDAKNWRTVDYERGIVLQALNTEPGKYSRGGMQPFNLLWDEQKIFFKLDQAKIYVKENSNKPSYLWELCVLEIPPHLQDKREEIYQLIYESVSEWGYIYDRSRVEEIHIDFTKFEKAANQSIN